MNNNLILIIAFVVGAVCIFIFQMGMFISAVVGLVSGIVMAVLIGNKVEKSDEDGEDEDDKKSLSLDDI